MPFPAASAQVQPIKTPSYQDLMAQRDAFEVQQNALAQQRRKVQENALLNRAYAEAYDPATGAIDANKLYGTLASGGMGAQIPAQMETISKSRKATTDASAASFKHAQEVLTVSRNELGSANTPQEAVAAGLRIAQQYPEAADSIRQSLAGIEGMTPEQFGAWKMDALRKNLSAENRLKQHYITQNLGGSTRVLSVPEYGAGGATVVPGSEAELTLSPAQANPVGKLVQDENGNYVLVNTRTAGAAPVTMGGGVPTGRGGPVDPAAFRSAVVQAESRGDYTAVSPKGALGAYQVMPATAKTLAGRLGLSWNPELMRSNTPEGRQYQDAIGGAALQEALDASGGDPARAAMYYHGGSDTGKWGPKTRAYAQQVQANMAVPGQQVRGPVKQGKAASADVKAPTADEKKASYNINRALRAAAEIQRVTKDNPSANVPGATEAFVSSLPLISQGVNFTRSSDRQIVVAAQRDLLDALLYLATGAAYNKEQLEGQMESYIPSYSDSPATVKSKRTRLAQLIADAKTSAGRAWTPQMDVALKALTDTPEAAPAAPPKRTARGATVSDW